MFGLLMFACQADLEHAARMQAESAAERSSMAEQMKELQAVSSGLCLIWAYFSQPKHQSYPFLLFLK